MDQEEALRLDTLGAESSHCTTNTSALGQFFTASNLGLSNFYNTYVFKQEALKDDVTVQVVRCKSSNPKKEEHFVSGES